ncbi:phosphatase PAP2 family protein [Pedobacter sp. SYSU D00535]|uniref:phosphatase PAP2 family protein n=1 Tax=Pedobacter sp. SYSU D00535 TaxID=2810308 RepID=UPI001A97BBD5|nr:phosphatase PAP2 family protein [Pedobacter sp. SYSU D00535]
MSSCFQQLYAQTDSLIRKLDSLGRKADTVGQTNVIAPEAYTQRTQITFKNYFVLLGSDIKQQLFTPFTMPAKDWVKVAHYGLGLSGLMFADRPIQRRAVIWRKDNPVLTNVSSFITNTGGTYEAITLAGLATYGFAFKNEKIKTTSLLASQAYITGITINTLLKNLAGRHRPSVVNPDRVEARPTFYGPFSNTGRDKEGKKLAASFPSAHATLAFAAATVYAMEYRDKPIIPILSYTGATLISLSRITENQHWTTDIVVGATIGYLTGRQVVNNYHRYAKIKRDNGGEQPTPQRKKVSLKMQYFQGSLLPGLVYTP